MKTEFTLLIITAIICLEIIASCDSNTDQSVDCIRGEYQFDHIPNKSISDDTIFNDIKKMKFFFKKDSFFIESNVPRFGSKEGSWELYNVDMVKKINLKFDDGFIYSVNYGCKEEFIDFIYPPLINDTFTKYVSFRFKKK